VGCEESSDVMEEFIRIGMAMKSSVMEALPDDWSFEGRRVLDFGCGCGRLLRHFAPDEAEVAEFHGVDIDSEQIEWLQANLSPPIASATHTGHVPPLPFPDSHFDLIMATSVFTHIADGWSAWLLEMQRVLKPDGLMLSTFLGPGTTQLLLGEPWDDDSFGMNALMFWAQPCVFHSEWWLRTHWGRMFEILRFSPSGFAQTKPDVGHGYMLLRPRPLTLTMEDLERDNPADPRYLTARRHHLRQLAREGAQLATMLGRAGTAYSSLYTGSPPAPSNDVGGLSAGTDPRGN
jgi:SAM-dependent methyltransferase